MAGVGSDNVTVAAATKRGGDGSVLSHIKQENAKDKKNALSHLEHKPEDAPAVPSDMHHYGKRHARREAKG